MMDNSKINEEVTVTPLIRDIERLIGKGFRGIKKSLYFILEGVAEFFALAFRYVWVLLIAIVLGGLLGFFSTKFIPRQYTSSMILKLNVEGKDQLLNDIHFFNALVSRSDHGELANILGLSLEDAQSISGFEAYAYSDFVEKTMAMQDIYGMIDTALFNDLDVKEQLNQNDAALSSRFKIIITASRQDVFKTIEAPLLAYLERVPELNNLLVSGQKALEFQRQVYVHEMARIDTLTKVLNEVMLKQASQPQSNGGGDMNVLMGPDQSSSSDVSAIDLQDRYIFYSQRISKIDNQIEKNKTCYFVSSHLNPYGEKTGYGRMTRAFFGAFIFFAFAYLFVGFRYWGKNAA